MNTFFKTFFVCLIITFSFLAYKYFSMTGDNDNLKISPDNPIFNYQDNINNNKSISDETKSILNSDKQINDTTPEINQTKTKYTQTAYFYSVNGELTPVKRELKTKPSLENSIMLLLKGPLIAESKKGIYTEIPANVDLISVKRNSDSIILNLSSNFGNGGGTQSIENRIKQLTKTVKSIEKNKAVYLYINGKEVEYLGGDGVYIKQPLE